MLFWLCEVNAMLFWLWALAVVVFVIVIFIFMVKGTK